MTDTPDGQDVTVDLLREMYRLMRLIRVFEEAAIQSMRRAEISGGIHVSIGQEAETVGACLALEPTDWITGTHRSHGHVLAKGASPAQVMAELMGKRSGLCHGKGGSMHLVDVAHGVLGESGIVGGTLPLAVGAALSSKFRGTGEVSLAFFGDGAANIGAFHESLNLAAVWSLPVVFVCENNGYALTTPVATAMGVPDVYQRAAAYGMPGSAIDGQEVLAVHAAVKTAVGRARAGGGPTLIEAKTYRYREHAELGNLVLGYRSSDEVEAWQLRDPIELFRRQLAEGGRVPPEDLDRLDDEVSRTVDDAVQFARAAEVPSPEALFSDA